MRFQGKIAVVTGGNRGIGRAAAERLAREGATVLIVGRDRVDNAAAAQALNLERPGTAEAFAVDVTDAAAIAEFAAAVRASYGHVDILVNNAGICHLTTAFTELTDAAWQETLAVNLFGVLRFPRALLPLLLAAGAASPTATARERAPSPRPRPGPGCDGSCTSAGSIPTRSRSPTTWPPAARWGRSCWPARCRRWCCGPR